MTRASAAAGAPAELVVGGMNCAACAARIENRHPALRANACREPRRVRQARGQRRRPGGCGAPGDDPAHSTLSLSPFGLDIVLLDPGSLSVGDSVPLVLTFRNAGRVTVDATVTPRGTP